MSEKITRKYMGTNKSAIRLRAIFLVVFMLIVVAIEIHFSFNSPLLHIIEFAILISLGVALFRQRCEQCEFPWYENKYPIEERKASILDTWKRDFYPNVFGMNKKCPKCDVLRY